jgi:hypothetical protein
MKTTEREARYKLYRLDQNHALTMLNWNDYMFISLPITKGLPDGFIIEALNYDYQHDCLMARVYHDSFDVIAPGVAIPIADDWINVDQISVSTEAYNRALEDIRQERIKKLKDKAD